MRFEITVMLLILLQITVIPATFFIKLQFFVSMTWLKHRKPNTVTPCQKLSNTGYCDIVNPLCIVGPVVHLFRLVIRSTIFSEKMFLLDPWPLLGLGENMSEITRIGKKLQMLVDTLVYFYREALSFLIKVFLLHRFPSLARF